MRVGVQLPEVERRVSWSEYAAMAHAAESVGFDSIWLGDHLLYRDDGREERGPWDAWSLLAALAATTHRVRLGPLVACTAFAAPGLLARRAAAVQEISAGRLVLGLGAGWNDNEFRAFGLPPDARASRFIESFDVIRRLLDGERVSADGRFVRTDDAVLLPRPAQRPMLMIGSTGERVLRATLPHVDAWNAWFEWFDNTPEGFSALNEHVSQVARDVHRDPTTLQRTATAFVALGDATGDRPHAEVAPVTGTSAAIAGRLKEFQATGVDELILVLSPINEASIRSLSDVVASITP